MILKWMLKKQDKRLCTGFSWFRIGSNGGSLWARQWSFGQGKSGEFTDQVRTYQLVTKDSAAVLVVEEGYSSTNFNQIFFLYYKFRWNYIYIYLYVFSTRGAQTNLLSWMSWPSVCPRILFPTQFRRFFRLFYCHSPFVMSLNLFTTHISAVSQCLPSYATDSSVVRSGYKPPNTQPIQDQGSLKYVSGTLLKPMLRYISSPHVDNKYVEKLL